MNYGFAIEKGNTFLCNYLNEMYHSLMIKNVRNGV